MYLYDGQIQRIRQPIDLDGVDDVNDAIARITSLLHVGDVTALSTASTQYSSSSSSRDSCCIWSRCITRPKMHMQRAIRFFVSEIPDAAAFKQRANVKEIRSDEPLRNNVLSVLFVTDIFIHRTMAEKIIRPYIMKEIKYEKNIHINVHSVKQT